MLKPFKLINLKEVLKKVIALLSDSRESDWSPLSPEEVINILKTQVSRIEQNLEVDKDQLRLEFAPTSTIQEIAMTNGWSDEYLKLSAKLDELIL